MRLFDFTPETIELVQKLAIVISIVAPLMVLSSAYYAISRKLKKQIKDKDVASQDLAKSLHENMKEYAQLRNENTALLRRIKDLEAKIKRVDQPREGGRFAVKKNNNSNIGKYECIADNLDYFTPGRFYERYDNGSESLILIANNRMRRNMSYLRKSFRLVEA